MTNSIMIALLAVLLVTHPAFANEGETHPPGTTHAEAVAPSASAGLEASVAALSEAIAAQNLAPVHELAEDATKATKSLIAQQQLTGDAATRLEAAGRQFAVQLGELHEASDRKDAAATSAQFVKVKAAYQLLKARLPKAEATKQ